MCRSGARADIPLKVARSDLPHTTMASLLLQGGFLFFASTATQRQLDKPLPLLRPLTHMQQSVPRTLAASPNDLQSIPALAINPLYDRSATHTMQVCQGRRRGHEGGSYNWLTSKCVRAHSHHISVPLLSPKPQALNDGKRLHASWHHDHATATPTRHGWMRVL